MARGEEVSEIVLEGDDNVHVIGHEAWEEGGEEGGVEGGVEGGEEDRAEDRAEGGGGEPFLSPRPGHTNKAATDCLGEGEPVAAANMRLYGVDEETKFLKRELEDQQSKMAEEMAGDQAELSFSGGEGSAGAALVSPAAIEQTAAIAMEYFEQASLIDSPIFPTCHTLPFCLCILSPDSSSRFDNQMPSLSAIVEQTAIAMEYIEQMPSLNDLPKLEANVDELIT